MNYHRAIVTLIAVLLVSASSSFAQGQPTLKVGDPAPPLQVSSWAQGEAITGFEKGNVYVLECWATWCGPCVAAIPHLSEMNTKLKDKGVVIIGMNVWERDTSKVAPFIAKMGEKMNYRVAMDDTSKHERGAMAETWMKAAGRNGIPCSFVVDKEGKIAWIGHPMAGLDRVVELSLEDKFDAKAEAARQAKIDSLRKEMTTTQRAGEWEKAVKVIDQLVELDPEMAVYYAPAKVRIQFNNLKDYDAGYAAVDALVKKHPDDERMLISLAHQITSITDAEKRKGDVAIDLAERANTLTGGKDGNVMVGVAMIYQKLGNLDKAVEVGEKALESDIDPRSKPRLKQMVDQWRKQRDAKKATRRNRDPLIPD